MRVIGTAGHVDHGKSTLVRALTGIDPDRLKEEKARGMTIDLGFAWMELAMPDGAHESVGIVDVPGHIDFIKNMLAGVGGVDAVVLVIAADEGVMPQTREHLAILDLLAISSGVVALTKCDLVDDPEWLDLVELDIVALLEHTNLASVPIIRMSAATGAGLTELRAALGQTLANLPLRKNRGRPRLPIDRVFTLSGFGVVVTGTLSDGLLRLGDAVEVLPARLPARVRGLQTHKQPVSMGQPGSRLAVNLSGVEVSQLRRGDVVALPDSIQPTRLLDARFRLLHDVPDSLRHNQRVDFFVGASETPANVRILGAEKLEPGQEGWVQLRFDRPVATATGDRFILRLPSPSVTLGGGDVLSPHPQRRWRRFDAATLTRFETLAKGDPEEILLQLVVRRPFTSVKELRAQSELDEPVVQSALASLLGAGALLAFETGAETLIAPLDSWLRIVEHLRSLLGDFHKQSPLRRGMARGEVRSRLQVILGGVNLSLRLFNLFIERAQREEIVAADDGNVWLADFAAALSPEQQAAIDRALAAFAAAPFAPPNLSECLELLDGKEELLEMLIEQGRLVRLGGEVLFRSEDFAVMSLRVQEYIVAHGSLTLAEARDLFQTSRKFVQALLEELDARRITRRVGEGRVLR